MNICRFCSEVSPAKRNICETCFDDIKARYHTMPVAKLSGEYGISHSAMCSLWRRYKPEGTGDHPNAKQGALASHRANGKARKAAKLTPVKTDLYGPPINPREAIGCRFPEGDPREANYRICQAEQQRGSSYCAYHYAVSIRGDDIPDANPFTPQGRTARTPVQAYA